MTFAQHLQNLMNERGWSKSDLAREMYGSCQNPKTGHWGARNRCNIGDWLSGRKHPKPVNLELLAMALGVTVAELTPPTSKSKPWLKWTIGPIAGNPEGVELKVEGCGSPDLIRRVLAVFETEGLVNGRSEPR